MKLNIGEWIAYGDDGTFYSFNKQKLSFHTKREAIEHISCYRLDSRRIPKVLRIAKGHYEYFLKDVDFGNFGDSFTIKKVTSDNVDDFKKMYEEQREIDNN